MLKSVRLNKTNFISVTNVLYCFDRQTIKHGFGRCLASNKRIVITILPSCSQQINSEDIKYIHRTRILINNLSDMISSSNRHRINEPSVLWTVGTHLYERRLVHTPLLRLVSGSSWCCCVGNCRKSDRQRCLFILAGVVMGDVY